MKFLLILLFFIESFKKNNFLEAFKPKFREIKFQLTVPLG